jgi:gamma-glutamyltranspeptidase/glutathione hydrolase
MKKYIYWMLVAVFSLAWLPRVFADAAVAVPDRFAADTAGDIFKQGGNAVDAAVAIAFTLSVTYPEAGNLGGGGFATVYFGGHSYFLDYRERAPHAASASMYLDAKGQVVPDLSTVGVKAAAVPGTVAGLWDLHRRFGRLPWKADLEPAIRYAEKGFSVRAELAQSADDFSKTLAGRTNFSQYFGSLQPGQLLRQPELARSLRRIAVHGRDGFYQGDTARLIAADMHRNGGLISLSDLKAYQTVWRDPILVDWAGYQVVTAPPPSSGGIGLVALLKMKETLSPAFSGVLLNSAQYVHLIAEIEKRVFADRAEYLGDPDFFAVPVAQLTDTAYLQRRAHEVQVDSISTLSSVGPGLVPHHNTTHFSVIDADGNAVANTYTLNDEFGSGAVVKGAGFLLNNEMDDFSVKPGTPNIYGVVGGDANAIAPGKRPLSSMTPTILTRDGKVALVIGTPGGSRIFTSVFQVITNWHDFAMPLKEAVSATRVHHQLLPENLIYEEPYQILDQATRSDLISRGYRLENQNWNGDIQAIEVATTGLSAVPDPRGSGVGRVFGNLH